jgi:hypothetical protein
MQAKEQAKENHKKIEDMKKVVMRIIENATAEVAHYNMPYKMDNSAIHGRLRNTEDSLSIGQVIYTTRVLAEEGKLKKESGPVVHFSLLKKNEEEDKEEVEEND